MAAKSLAKHLFSSGDSRLIRETILGFLSSNYDGQCVDCDYLESLNILVSNLLDFHKIDEQSELWVVEVLTNILTETCIPSLCTTRLKTCDADKKYKMKILDLTYDLVAKIASRGTLEHAKYVWMLVLKSLQNFVDESNVRIPDRHQVECDQEPKLQVATALDLLANLLETVNNWQNSRLQISEQENFEKGIEKSVLNGVLDVLGVAINGNILFKITGQILPKLLTINEETFFQNTKIIWEAVKRSRLQEEEDKNHHYSDFFASYAILSSLAYLYFEQNDKIAFGVHRDPAFWFMIQAGLVQTDSLVRKRSLYLLQKVVQMCKEQGEVEEVFLEKSSLVYFWNPDRADEIVDIWQQYVFFFEILEEKQLHVIQPVLPRIIEIVNATKNVGGTAEIPLLDFSILIARCCHRTPTNFLCCFVELSLPLLHVSWLSVIVHRAAIHENRFLKKWGIMTLLTLDFDQVPLLLDSITRNFICDTFIMLLKEPTLYSKNNGESKAEPSALSKQLLVFFNKCYKALHDEEMLGFFTQVFTSISLYNISHVPLTFITQSLSNVPRIALFGSELITIIRSIITNMVSHAAVLRGAVKTFLLKTYMNFIDPRKLSINEVCVFLGLFVKEESLCRGTPLWNEVTAWLCENLTLFQRETNDLLMCLENLVRAFLKDEYSAKSSETGIRLAKFLLLCYDCCAITKNQVNQLFELIFGIISKAHSNVYQPVFGCWHAVELLHGLFHELLPVGNEITNADDTTTRLMSSLHDVMDDLTQTVIRTIGQDDEYSSFYGYRACFAMLDKVKSLWLSYQFSEIVSLKYQKLINRLADLCFSLLDNQQEAQCMTVKRWLHLQFTLKLMIWVIEIADALDIVFSNERWIRFLKVVFSFNLVSDLRFPNEGKCLEAGSLLNEGSWRVVAEDIIATKWCCFNLALNNEDIIRISSSETLASYSSSDIVDACVHDLSLTSGSAFHPCLKTLRLCLHKLVEEGDTDTVILLLKTSWTVLNEIRTRYSGYFWPAFNIVVRTVFAPELLSLSAQSLLISHVRTYWKSLLKIADDQSGLVGVAVAHLCKVFSGMYQSHSADGMSVDFHVDIIADICLFGPVHKKDLRLLLDTAAYVRYIGEQFGAVSLVKFKECECESARVRVDLLAFLLSLDGEDQVCSVFLVKLIKVLLERNQMLSEIKASRFLNSENHRQKQRLWQVVVVIVSRITSKEFALKFSSSMLKALESDNQTSVRFLMEWSLVRLFSHHSNLLERIWQKMQNFHKVRLGYVASILSIATHVFFTLKEPKSQIEYLQRLIPTIVPCAFLNHSHIRAYILSALRLISDACAKDVWYRISQQFPIAQSCLMFTESVVEGEKEKKRLQKDRYLFSLHPINDFSIEVIFETVPLISGVVNDEIVTPDVFKNEGSMPWVEVRDLPLYRRKPKKECGVHELLGESKTPKTVPELAHAASSDAVRSEKRAGGDAIASDVQKKITPWNVIAPSQEDQDNFEQLRHRPIERRVGDLIVVASLIDRAPNLGGLCRTCEIFGASKLVLGSKHVVSEKDFKSISVSSEKWIEVEEVKVQDLKTYLLRMKKEGFTVVGVEQTAQSKELTDFQFPCSTVLVLGNEKAGMPVEIIQLLDECVEIPQHGIIRSLNVHVTGALFIWEYSRQHLNSK